MKNVLVTGASRGIGRETARKFYENGYNVIINYNKSEKAALDLQSELPNSMIIQADVSNEAEVKNMVDAVVEKYGTIFP